MVQEYRWIVRDKETKKVIGTVIAPNRSIAKVAARNKYEDHLENIEIDNDPIHKFPMK